ncbi:MULTISPECIES: hypothetical protein [Pseudomonas]|uniref:Pesticin C-terminal domain-containing protein n=2 Tax=Pseudomonas TaxID=286 RepID=B1J801_PSEPW|nr:MULTISPECIES: hypothetical protein [Pseudomonas]MBP2082949.1 GH24 family phage-related lysozyme (muramidase) [Pseudomonas sp. PvP089]MBP2091348.1 GH24 family phage-related lysozyme (muramidase) [Pseudomonas sp. PvP088]MBP2222489.1 GH24 family phage-related lysozyme (muramidase) [Pseudomonas putida]MDZ4021510.1 hypothetical protein [Pseudomonas sichuanensis]PMY79398.1 hypothetical protein C1X72_20295 [Pseudomonas sp. FW306-2-2C-D06B]
MENQREHFGLSRREMLIFLGAMAWATTRRAQAAPTPFDTELAQAIASNDLSFTGADREKFMVYPGDQPRSQGGYRGHPSDRQISTSARSLIVACEVTSEANYRSKLQSPIWPGGESGVTIGIGYDLGYTTAANFRSDWARLLPEPTVVRLARCCGTKGRPASQKTRELRDDKVGWTESNTQFDAYLRYVVGQTEDTFKNCSHLHLDSFGALVSLIYNRGASLSRTSDRRREMREIYALMRDRDFGAIPTKFRDMKRLWKDDPQARGLLKRRELEALLFEQGLKA